MLEGNILGFMMGKNLLDFLDEHPYKINMKGMGLNNMFVYFIDMIAIKCDVLYNYNNKI